MFLFHLPPPDLRVRRGPEQHDDITRPPEQRLHLVVPRRRNHRLCARLRRTRYIMRQRRRHLDLKARDVSNREAQGPSDDHVEPERDIGQMRERDDYRYVAGEEHERDKEE